jgi:hypothetical protein
LQIPAAKELTAFALAKFMKQPAVLK